tara:strand:+ start:5092 stop:5373 length:282 start_codon:yes stop_codon:yes gene_type:complete
MSEDYLAKNSRPIKLKGGTRNYELFTPFGLSIEHIDKDNKINNNYKGVLPTNKYDYFLQNTEYKNGGGEKTRTRKRKASGNIKTKKGNSKTIL